jgi:hypothetical protein
LRKAPSRDAPLALPDSESTGVTIMVEGSFEEMERFGEPSHVEAVRSALEANFDKWFMRYCREAPVGAARFAKGAGRAAMRAAVMPASDPRAHLGVCTREAVSGYDRQAASYRALLEPECLEQYGEELRIFAKEVANQLPVINKALNGPLEEMAWWKKRFRQLMKREAERLYHLFVELVAFADGYADSIPSGDFLSLTEPWQLALEPMNPKPHRMEEEWADEPVGGEADTCTLSIPGTVSVGITSMVLHHLDPLHFAPRTRHMLAALYFLTDRGNFGLRSSEFLLWSVKTGSLGHNHYYPYPLFMTHVVTVARLLRAGYAGLGVDFPESHAMVLTASFLQFVANAHEEEVATWKGESEC